MNYIEELLLILLVIISYMLFIYSFKMIFKKMEEIEILKAKEILKNARINSALNMTDEEIRVEREIYKAYDKVSPNEEIWKTEGR